MIHILTGKLYNKVEHLAELDVFDAYMLRVSGDWSIGPTFMDHNQLLFVAEGSLALTIDGKEIILSAGEAYLVRRHSTFSSCVKKSRACRFYVVLYSSSIERYEVLYGQVFELTHKKFYAEDLFADIVSYDKHIRDTAFLLDTTLAVILEKLYLFTQWDPQDERIDEIVEYISNHLDEPLTVEELSSRFHYSGDYMGRLFRRRYDMSVKQYVIGQKVACAKRLLSISNMSIESVGLALGFSDEVLFRKFFKYHVGNTPKHYRKMYGELK